MPSRSLRIVVPRYGASVTGGSEALGARIAGALAERGWTVEAWATDAIDEATWGGHLPRAELGADGVRVHRYPVATRRPPRAFHQASRVFFRLPAAVRPEGAWVRLQGPFAPRLVRALAAANGPTLFTPYLYYPTLAGLPRAPRPRLLIPGAHDERPFRLRAVGRAIAHTDALLYGTPEERELVEEVHPVARDKPNAVGTIGIEIPVGAADGEGFRRERGISGPLLVYGGRTAAGKGVDTLLDAFARARRERADLRLVMTGDAPDGQADGVVVTGHLDAATWASCLAAATAVVVPGSLESLSMLALEAWAAGRPCILNATSPVLAGQARRSGGALTFTDAAGLAAAMLHLAGDAQLARTLGEAGRAYVATAHRWDDVAARIADLIDRAEPRS